MGVGHNTVVLWMWGCLNNLSVVLSDVGVLECLNNLSVVLSDVGVSGQPIGCVGDDVWTTCRLYVGLWGVGCVGTILRIVVLGLLSEV